MYFNIYSTPQIVAALLLATLGIFVYLQNKKSVVNITFSLMSLCTVLWLLFYFVAYQTKAIDKALIWFKFGYTAVIFIPIATYHFIINFLQRKREQTLIFLTYFFGMFLTYNVFFTNNFIDGLYRYFWGYYPKVSFLHPLYLLVLTFLVTRLLYLLYITYKQESHSVNDYNKIRYMFVACLFLASACIDFIPNYHIEMYPWGFIFVVLYLLTIAYAIVRHQLMGIEVIIKKTVVFAGLFASVFAVFAFFTVLGQIFFEKFFTVNRWVAMVPSVLVVTFMLRPLENFLINTTDKFLFQKKYDYKELLKTFTVEVLTILDLSKLVNLTVDKLIEIVKISSSAVLLFDENKQQFDVLASKNIKDPQVALIRPDGIVTFLEQTHGYLLISDLKEKKIAVPVTIQEIIDKLNAELIIPMVLHDKVIGILSLGKKKSDEGYTQDDLDILLPLARTLAIAISNAQLFVELSKTQQEAAQKEKMAVIGTLASGINHEICNPLGIARGQCEAFLLNKKDGIYRDKPDTEQLTEAMRIMELVIKETDRATSITKKLSSFAKPSKGELTDDVDISKELDEVISLVGYELKLDKIELVKNIPPSLPRIRADKKQLQEIFFNLIRNAAQAITESGRISVSAREEGDVSLSEVGDVSLKNAALDVEKRPHHTSEKRPQHTKVIIDISDTGCGIPEDKLGMIFNPFYTTKEPGKGTGLGLFIVRQVVERNRGRISLKSKAGEGTTFTLEFPIS